jgi:hypothetical protein
MGKFFDQALLQHAADGTVKRAGTECDLAIGTRGDVLHDGVAVAVAIGERDQDVEDSGREWRINSGVCHDLYQF